MNSVRSNVWISLPLIGKLYLISINANPLKQMNIRLFLLVAIAAMMASVATTETTIAQQSEADYKKVTAAMQSIYPEPRNQVDCEFPRDKNGKVDPAILKKLNIQSSAERFGHNGYIVSDSTGRIVRVFLDKNKKGEKGAGALDEWIYFKDGVEVYREIDLDADERPDEYRWSGAGGSRWGIDKDENGEIDSWKVISAEEVALEVFEAIKTRNVNRYNRLLLTPQEFQSLQLTGELQKEAAKRLKAAADGFVPLVRAQKTISATSSWIHSGNGMPSMALADSKNLRKDLICYDHATSVYQTGSKVSTLALGTIVRVGNVWRIMELPQFVEGSKPIVNGGVLFPIPQLEPLMPDGGGTPMKPLDKKLVKLYENLAVADETLKKATEGAPMVLAQKKRVDVMVEIYNNVENKDEKGDWLKNIADTVAEAYSQDQFPQGLQFLRSFSASVARSKSPAGVDYIEWRAIWAEYGRALGEDRRQRDKARQTFLTQVEKFSSRFPKSKFAPVALWELGQSSEVDGDEDVALTWYDKLARGYPASDDGKRALGALRRIKGIGQKIPFKGETLRGEKFDIANPRLRGKIIVVHFWETWCADEPINQKGDTAFDEILKLNKKFKGEVEFIGANIEETTESFKKHMSENTKIQWTQLHAPGGMEKSPLATQVGIVSEPLILIFDGNGILVETEAAAGDLDRQIQRIRNKSRAQAARTQVPAATNKN